MNMMIIIWWNIFLSACHRMHGIDVTKLKYCEVNRTQLNFLPKYISYGAKNKNTLVLGLDNLSAVGGSYYWPDQIFGQKSVLEWVVKIWLQSDNCYRVTQTNSKRTDHDMTCGSCRVPKMRAIPQLVWAPINPIPIVEDFRWSNPRCQHSYKEVEEETPLLAYMLRVITSDVKALLSTEALAN